jgi:hypothetical protein
MSATGRERLSNWVAGIPLEGSSDAGVAVRNHRRFRLALSPTGAIIEHSLQRIISPTTAKTTEMLTVCRLSLVALQQFMSQLIAKEQCCA